MRLFLYRFVFCVAFALVGSVSVQAGDGGLGRLLDFCLRNNFSPRKMVSELEENRNNRRQERQRLRNAFIEDIHRKGGLIDEEVSSAYVKLYFQERKLGAAQEKTKLLIERRGEAFNEASGIGVDAHADGVDRNVFVSRLQGEERKKYFEFLKRDLLLSQHEYELSKRESDLLKAKVSLAAKLPESEVLPWNEYYDELRVVFKAKDSNLEALRELQPRVTSDKLDYEEKLGFFMIHFADEIEANPSLDPNLDPDPDSELKAFFHSKGL